MRSVEYCTSMIGSFDHAKPALTLLLFFEFQGFCWGVEKLAFSFLQIYSCEGFNSLKRPIFAMNRTSEPFFCPPERMNPILLRPRYFSLSSLFHVFSLLTDQVSFTVR